jgi:molybdopterin synthase sulfur carrier subunit
MKIELLYFGRPRERLNIASESVELPGDILTLSQLLEWLRMRGEVWTSELEHNRVRCAINQSMASASATLRENDEVAIFSPISGG